MADRRDLQEELNRINELYQSKDLEMRKSGASIEQRQQMRDMLNQKKDRLVSELGDDLNKLNAGKSLSIKGAKPAFKKLAGIIPMAGVGMAALQGDPAMAAEELIEDAMGPLAALKPATAGDVQGQNMFEAESQARKDYKKSPAYRNARGITEEDQDIEEMSKPKPKKGLFSKLNKLFGE